MTDPGLIHQPNLLAKRIGPRARVFSQALLQKAEDAFAQVARSFQGWLKTDVTALEAARAALGASPTEAEIKDLYRCARALRGSGSTFGYPVISSFADSLCGLVQKPATSPRWRNLVDAHVDAIAASLRDGVRTGEGAAAGLVEALSAQSKAGD